RDDVLHAADVVGDARLDLARARLGEERQRQALQVPVDGRAQVVHDALADDVRHPGLADAEDAGRDRDADHAPDQRDQQAVVVVRDRDVEDVAQQERRDHAEPGAQHDQRQYRGQTAAVRAEERDYAARTAAYAATPRSAALGSRATSSTSPMLITGWNFICSRP